MNFTALANLKEKLEQQEERQELISRYNGVINIRQALESWNGESTVIVDDGCDERNGSYNYEVHVQVYPASYQHDCENGSWVASREYVGGLNRLSDNDCQYFHTQQEAVEFVKQYWF